MTLLFGLQHANLEAMSNGLFLEKDCNQKNIKLCCNLKHSVYYFIIEVSNSNAAVMAKGKAAENE